MPEKICKVPCKPVKDDLDKMWSYLGKKVPYIVFSLVLGGLLTVAVYFGETNSRRQETLFKAVMGIQKTVSGIQGELKHFNGQGKGDRR